MTAWNWVQDELDRIYRTLYQHGAVMYLTPLEHVRVLEREAELQSLKEVTVDENDWIYMELAALPDKKLESKKDIGTKNFRRR